MISARPESLLPALLLAALLAGPALAAKPPSPPPPLPPLELPAAAPLIEVEIAGRPARLTVDPGADDIVQINPDSPVRAALAATPRPDGRPVERGLYRVAVGQSSLAIPFVRDTLTIAGRAIAARVLLPATAPPGQPPGSDGVIGLPLLPQPRVMLVQRPATAADHETRLPARIGRSDSWGFDWPLAGGARLDVELHPLRATSVMSAAAGSALSDAGNGQLVGPVERVTISFGAMRPVRHLQLARPVIVAGLPLAGGLVRLFDWAGNTSLPPDADPNADLVVTGSRGRQGRWANVKLGHDVLAVCAQYGWQRTPPEMILVCPLPK
jgi:hypothetical protein